jgi:hypothetical protein
MSTVFLEQVEVVVVVMTMVVQMPTLAIEETGGTEETEETEAVVLEAMLMGVAMADAWPKGKVSHRVSGGLKRLEPLEDCGKRCL